MCVEQSSVALFPMRDSLPGNTINLFYYGFLQVLTDDFSGKVITFLIVGL